MPLAARLTDFHICPKLTSSVPPIPHVGGPIIGPGAASVMINGLPAAKVGDKLVCTGPPDSIIKGSSSVLIEGMSAARTGDPTEHGGEIVMGSPNVFINE